MSEVRPRVTARPAQRAPVEAALAPQAGAQRVPSGARMPQKQSPFDMGSTEVQAPWGAQGVKLLGQKPILGSDTAVTQPIRQPASRELSQAIRAVAIGQADSYPEIDRLIERQAATRPFSQGESQALLESLESALTRVSAPENSGDPCVKSLPPEALTSAATLKSRLSASISSMKPGDSFEATDQELSGVEKILGCAKGLKGTGSSSIGAWLVFGGAVATVIYLIGTSGE